MKNKYACKKQVKVALFAAAAFVISTNVAAIPYYYTDWMSWNPGDGTAAGIITPGGGSDVAVTFEALTSIGGAGSFLGIAGNWLWAPDSTYQSSQVDNAPEYEGLQLVGTSNMTYRVTLSEAIKDPIMAVATLGSSSDSAKYVFDSPFTILSQGDSCCWGSGTLSQQPGNILEGWEGSGVIQFIGTYSTFSWTVPDPEYWHGFTFGIRTTERLEPGPGTVPEPPILALMILGFLGIGFARKIKAAP